MIQTNCSGCVFAIVKNDKQTGCELNRLHKLGATDAIEHNGTQYKTISRFCNAFRPKKWLESLSLDESLDPQKTVENEIQPRVGFLILLDTNQENALNYLEATLMGIRDQTHSSARYVIVATDKVEYNEGIYKMLLKFFNENETSIHVLQLLEVPENKFLIIDEAFKLALNGWLYVTTSGELVDRNLLKDLDTHLNKNMKKLSVVLPYDGINGFLLQTALFKYLNGNKTKVWDIDKSDSRMFLEKVKDLDTMGDCILTWRDIDAS